MTTLTIIGRDGCHLCGAAEDIVEAVLADLPEDVPEIVVEHASVLDDASLYEAWWDKIPVVLIDGHLHAHWRLSADRLREALIHSGREGGVLSEGTETKGGVLSEGTETKGGVLSEGTETKGDSA